MSALPSEIQRPMPSLKAGQAVIVGRIFEFDRSESAVYTTIQTPALDEYSHPGNHRVTSSRVLGKVGDSCRVLVQLGGYRRSYQNKQGEKVFTVDNILRAVEE